MLADIRVPDGPANRMWDALCITVRGTDKAIALVQRAASTSMWRAVRRNGPNLRPHDVRTRKDLDVVMWVRDPFDRFASIYHMTRGSALDKLLAGEQNPHWEPQTRMHAGYPNIRYHAFETLQQTWAEEFPDYALGSANVKPHKTFAELELAPDIIEKLRVYYADDFALRKELGY